MTAAPAETPRLLEGSPETVEALSGMRGRMFSEAREAHVEAVLRSGSDELEREARAAAKAEWDGRAQSVIGTFAAYESGTATNLHTLGFPEAVQTDLERIVADGAKNPYDGIANPFLVKRGRQTGEAPTLFLNVEAIDTRLQTVESYRQLPGLTEAQRAALDDIAGMLHSIKNLDPLAVRLEEGRQEVLQSPHMKFAGKLGKFSLLALGAAAGVFGIAGTVMNYMSEKEEDRKPHPFLLGPLMAWAALNWKSMNRPPAAQIVDQVSTLNNPRMQELLSSYASASPEGFGSIVEQITAQPNSAALRKLLAAPESAEARKEALDELMPQGTDEEARASLAQMMADGRFADFHRMLKDVRSENAREFVRDFIRTEGYAGFEARSVRPPVA